MLCKRKLKNLEFDQGVNFDIIGSLDNNGTTYLLAFDESCEKICNSKAFVDLGTAVRHGGLSTIYFERKLFHQGKLGRDFELQNTHIVLLNFHRDVMKVTIIGAQWSLGSALVDWY